MNPRAPLLAGLTLGLFGQPISAAQPLLLNETSITDAYLEERADGPVQGYRANRSATATRTDTDLRDTPQSIDVVPAQVIKDLNTTRIDRALDFAGGVSRQNNFGGLTFLNYSVRGFTTGELYKNGFAINRGSYSAPDTSNIERIEVLKGPAASLYGRGDPGGLVNIVTKRPRPKPSVRSRSAQAAGTATAPPWTPTRRWTARGICWAGSTSPSKTTTASAIMSAASAVSSAPP